MLLLKSLPIIYPWVWAHNTRLTLPLFIGVPVPSQPSEFSCVCVSGVNCASIFMIFIGLLNCSHSGMFCFSFYCYYKTTTNNTSIETTTSNTGIETTTSNTGIERTTNNTGIETTTNNTSIETTTNTTGIETTTNNTGIGSPFISVGIIPFFLQDQF
jgi:hypothetical protein